jgi:hypothetical protein
VLQLLIPPGNFLRWLPESPAGTHPTNKVNLSSHNHRVPASRKCLALLLALLFLGMASEQAMHTHRSNLPASKQVSDSLDSNAAARCHLCLHSQAAPLGSVAVSVSPYVGAEATLPPSPLEMHASGEKWVHHVRPPPVA